MLCGHVNKQNCRFWCDENPRIIQALHAQKVASITSAKIIDPYFFEDVDGATVTVKGDDYRQMILEYLLPRLEDLDMQNLRFHQDGATPHTAR